MFENALSLLSLCISGDACILLAATREPSITITVMTPLHHVKSPGLQGRIEQQCWFADNGLPDMLPTHPLILCLAAT
jgi:hypothetical protein